jgi:hypothetical protein
MTSSATARARARRQLRTAGIDSVPHIAPREQESTSHLRVVPRPEVQRRRMVPRATLFVFGISVFIIAVIIFQATIAEQQLRLDALTRDLRMAEAHYDNLRQQRAELLMPVRLREEAVMMGMYQGFSTKFVEVPAEVVAEVMASTAKMNPQFADPSTSAVSAGVIAQADPLVEGQP